MSFTKTHIEVISGWMYRKSRPLDLARYQYHFENGNKEDVIEILKHYQNSDGGFAHALEPDCWNPNSSPIQTWYATEIIKEINGLPKEHEIIKGILKYLSSGESFSNGFWYNTIETNNEYPHAFWWTHKKDSENSKSYNPTINLAGFVLKYADKGTMIYDLAAKIVKQGFQDLLADEIDIDMHTILNFLRCYEYCKEVTLDFSFEKDKIQIKLKELIDDSLEKDFSKWKNEYVCMPSQYNLSPDSEFYKNNETICKYETKFICENFDKNDMWKINWSWSDYKEEWSISKIWWISNKIIINLLYLKSFKY